ncbi:MAG: hypothetical protein KDK27_12775, partial [Leptospiraceae bacterium]|nr:hypothetical protein [Leptospiraceae bacterium]
MITPAIDLPSQTGGGALSDFSGSSQMLTPPPDYIQQHGINNRAQRRRTERAYNRLVRHGRHLLHRFSPFLRTIAVICIFTFLHSILLPHLQVGMPIIAQTFDEFDQQTKNRIEAYVERADRQTDADAWTNYVEIGIATERTEWEEDAYEVLLDTYESIEADESLTDAEKAAEKVSARELLNAARLDWEADADEYMYSERGRWRADQSDLTVDAILQEAYEAALAAADAAVAADAELNLDVWDAVVAGEIDPERDAFLQTLQTRFDDAMLDAVGLTPEEQDDFIQELNRRRAEIESEFTLRDNFYVLRGRNRYVALKRNDDLSARLYAEAESAENQALRIIAEANQSVDEQTQAMLDEAEEQLAANLDGPDADTVELNINDLSGNWQNQMEAVIQAGLERWDEAAQQLYRGQMIWMSQNQATREQAEAQWKSSHEELKRNRDEWLDTVQRQIKDGRVQWEAQFAQFAQSRAAAEADLARYATEERERRQSVLAGLSDIVNGGGRALLEARDAYQYYSTLVQLNGPGSGSSLDGAVYGFYQEQAGIMNQSIASFTAMLDSVEAEMRANMHSDENFTGMLNDRRAFAGEALRNAVAALDVDDYGAELRTLMNAQSEDFVLYRRDMEELTARNAVFSERAQELEGNPDLDFDDAASLTELFDLLDGLEERYSDQQRELLRIYSRDRDTLTDAERLSAIKTDIQDWLDVAVDPDARLKQEVDAYFNAGYVGYYLTGNQSDPYLMTDAEYEWELLRRERNYYADRLRHAEAVKRYADLAAAHDAALELADLTAERAEAARVRAEIRDVIYLLIKGDVDLAPEVYSDDAVRDARYAELLAERNIDADALLTRETALSSELGLLDDMRSAGVPDVAELEGWIQQIDTYFTQYGPELAADLTDEERSAILNRQRLGAVRTRLLGLHAEISA